MSIRKDPALCRNAEAGTCAFLLQQFPLVIDIGEVIATHIDLFLRLFVTIAGLSFNQDHNLTDPLALIVSLYATVETIARDRGLDPDAPRHLNKVTETV